MDDYSLVSRVTSHVSDYKLVSFTVGAVDLYFVLESTHGLGNHICRNTASIALEGADQNSAQGHSSLHSFSMACGIWDNWDGSFYPKAAVNGPSSNLVMFGIFVAQLVEELECVRPCSRNLVCHQVGLLHFSDVLQLHS